MGFNTTVIVLNDAASQIREDPEFGRKLADAIVGNANSNRSRPQTHVRAGSHVNAATVVETHHADDTVVVGVGGNCATVLGHLYNCDHTDLVGRIALLRVMAEQEGYTLTRPRRAKPKAPAKVVSKAVAKPVAKAPKKK